ncbi:MAG TPA: rRNA maturation RNase YbeY [Planctomycetota bacterium]|jgi:probable rRNA maturation factor|nr:rRNA maturation RNase YbeY [Planctomycetota bacterium]MDP6129334.1 rRNA maturation RNase YbeY [Planctomycetota bacterium]MDP7245372.1 rRNA maturation RNase YbeY [Planctomycetota bacterium]HJM40502.1 rRNA maturation RNase YbeY [Planctomycetota bacterium]|tara:strand:+ start:22500 stop:22919 length:420 start_codon:yes stop_codon:yes gene_type:complete
MKKALQVEIQGEHLVADLPLDSLREVLCRAWKEYSGKQNAKIELVFLEDGPHSKLHKQFLGDPTSTDVMAFPYEDEDLFGEVFVNVDTASREAAERGILVHEELKLYSVHGVLHLLGFRDKTPEEQREMRDAEQKVLGF